MSVRRIAARRAIALVALVFSSLALPSFASDHPSELDVDRKPKLVSGGNCVIRNATVHTAVGPAFVGDVLVQKGKIAAVGKVTAPPGTLEIDGTGAHLAPGVVDCHSHIAVRGDVNEGTVSISAEVSVADVIDPDDLSIYRALAGGVTTARILHGSANAIGGRDEVLKLKWQRTADELRVRDRPEGIKFALGENPKRSNGRTRGERFPGSRMGVEALYYRAFARAREYMREWDEYEAAKQKGTNPEPPRRDVRLDALAGVLRKDILVHSHCYRADEILMLLRASQHFGFKIATLQHVLEGYKVAQEMAELGVGGSTFSDWWAYKIEAYDAIPQNAALMEGAGVLASLNSDSAELMRRLYQEAAKSVRYARMNPVHALALVTLNPARQLGLDKRIGSIEVGKDADLVLLNGDPLSSLARVRWSMVDGEIEFERRDAFGLEANPPKVTPLAETGVASANASSNGGSSLAKRVDSASSTPSVAPASGATPVPAALETAPTDPHDAAVARSAPVASGPQAAIGAQAATEATSKASTEPAHSNGSPVGVGATGASGPGATGATAASGVGATSATGATTARDAKPSLASSARPALLAPHPVAGANGEVIAITGGTLHPITSPDVEGGVVLMQNGRITALGKGLAIPAGARTIDATGMHVYPGMIALGTNVGLLEIGSIAATDDQSESGGNQPDVRVSASINADSAHIGVTRYNGITRAETTPQSGGPMRGQSAVLRLSGDTWEELLSLDRNMLHVEFPRTADDAKDKKEGDETKELRRFFKEAREYGRLGDLASSSGTPPPPYDPRLEALAPYARGEKRVALHADNAQTILFALKFAKEEKLDAVLYGAADAWKVVDALAREQVPVVVGPVLRMPSSRMDPYDAPYANAAVLARAGVPFAIMSNDRENVRNLPFHAAMAAAFGLPHEEALRAITYYPARILGIERELGSLAAGKIADVIVTDGDLLEITSRVAYVFIDGRQTDLTNRQTELYERYRERLHRLQAAAKEVHTR
jgi:imidazolonepropionase-like amidohydrolase